MPRSSIHAANLVRLVRALPKAFSLFPDVAKLIITLPSLTRFAPHFDGARSRNAPQLGITVIPRPLLPPMTQRVYWISSKRKSTPAQYQTRPTAHLPSQVHSAFGMIMRTSSTVLVRSEGLIALPSRAGQRPCSPRGSSLLQLRSPRHVSQSQSGPYPGIGSAHWKCLFGRLLLLRE